MPKKSRPLISGRILKEEVVRADQLGTDGMLRKWLIRLIVVGLICFVLGSALQIALFKKELWIWDVRKEQGEIRVRIDKLEAVDLEGMLHELKKYGIEIEQALLVLGYSREKKEMKK